MFRTLFFSTTILAFSNISSAMDIVVKYGPAQTSCYISVTDPAGITVNPNNGNWMTSGIFGNGCPSAPLPVPSFVTGYELSGSSTANTNVPFALAWRADADYCQPDSTKSTATGWQAGTKLCGAGSSPSMNCGVAATQTVNVTASTPGTYSFGIECYKNGNNTPVKSNKTVVVSTPVGNPSVTNFISTASSPAVNAQFTLSWQANADRCSTEGSNAPGVNGWPTNADVCGGSAGGTCANPQVPVTATTTGLKQFVLTCYKTGNSTTATASVDVNVVSGPPVGCPATTPPGRQTSGSVLYASDYVQGLPAYVGVDFTDYLTVFGDKVKGGTTPFPGYINRWNKVWFNSAPNAYVSLQFIPSAGQSGKFTYTATHTKVATSIVISKCPGDFTKIPWCVINNQKSETGKLLWTTVAGSLNQCVLTPGQTYFFNMTPANLDTLSSPNCANPLVTECAAAPTLQQ